MLAMTKRDQRGVGRYWRSTQVTGSNRAPPMVPDLSAWPAVAAIERKLERS
jgi:hypothetical protein